MNWISRYKINKQVSSLCSLPARWSPCTPWYSCYNWPVQMNSVQQMFHLNSTCLFHFLTEAFCHSTVCICCKLVHGYRFKSTSHKVSKFTPPPPSFSSSALAHGGMVAMQPWWSPGYLWPVLWQDHRFYQVYFHGSLQLSSCLGLA